MPIVITSKQVNPYVIEPRFYNDTVIEVLLYDVIVTNTVSALTVDSNITPFIDLVCIIRSSIIKVI